MMKLPSTTMGRESTSAGFRNQNRHRGVDYQPDVERVL